MTQQQRPLPEAQMGPAEKLLDLVLGSSAHLWHNRLGMNVNHEWKPAKKGTPASRALRPGLFVPAAERLYARLVEIYQLNSELAARFASYALLETEWRDLKVACAALMLVQPKAGQGIAGLDGTIEFHDDDYRTVGEAMVLKYEKKSTRMMTPKGVLRVAELLETPEIAALNRKAGFADPASKKPPLGRWKQAATRWLRLREQNLGLLEGLVKAGYKETIKKIARKAGYKPETQLFFELLGWKQKQAKGGHRKVGLGELKLAKRERFDGLSEVEICEAIEQQRLKYKDVTGRLPKDVGLTPAIFVALLPSLSDRDLRMLTPTIEELGLLAVPEVQKRWEQAIAEATDQRALNVAKNVKSKEIRQKLEEAADVAVKKAVSESVRDADIHVMFLIDKSGSMEGAITQSKEALSRMLAGFPLDRVHVATFDTMGTVLVPKAASRAAVTHMLQGISAGGGTIHGAAVRALRDKGLRIAATARLIVIVVGDECGEDGATFARTFQQCDYRPDALALIVSVASSSSRGNSVRGASAALGVPYSEVQVASFDDPYQVPRVLKALLDAPAARVAGPAQVSAWVEKVMKTPILTKDHVLAKAAG